MRFPVAIFVRCVMAPLLLGASSIAQACLEFQGEFTQGGLVWGHVAAGSTVTLDGEALDVLPDGTTFAGFGRDAAPTAQLVVKGPDGECSRELDVSKREYRIQRVEGVPKKTVEPDPEHLARDLTRLSEKLRSTGLPESERACVQDQLGILAARCQWVQDGQQRTFLEGEIDRLWERLGGRP